MKSKLHEPDIGDNRRKGRLEDSPVRTSINPCRNSSSRVSNNKIKVTTSQSPSPAPRVAGGTSPAPGPGRTPQTKRRELSLTTLEKNSPNGSPRNVTRTSSSGNVRKTGTSKTKSDPQRDSNVSSNNEAESSRKSSNSSQDSGIGRESKLSRADRARSGLNLTRSLRNPPIIRTTSPERVDSEVSNRKRFEDLCDIKNIELGMVKVPPDILEDLINKEKIEKFYTVDEVPVAR